jgi:cyanophycin synthetase
MVPVQLDLGALSDRPTSTLPDFAGRLLTRLPWLLQHGCSVGLPGGVVQRLEAGTWLGHVAEHVALELQARIGYAVTRGKTRSERAHRGSSTFSMPMLMMGPALPPGGLPSN